MIKLKGIHNLLVKAEVRHHQILADTAPDNGGQDEGMNPHEILETALAACTAITLKMYARRKNMPLDDVHVAVHTVSEGKESVLSRKIDLIGELSDEDKKRLMEIADKCPIHKLLTSQITISKE
ncbi:MAG: OsmC family protein [Bdellovibrionaceae bacterium]|nr:OsmC family protein [Pseudobdellovibrionaceae bacterium]